MQQTIRLARRALAAAALGMAFAAAASQGVPPVKDEPYPGVIALRVDVTDLDHKIYRVQETLPVQPGRLTLLYPRWLPGTHGPYGETPRLAGLRVRAGSATLPWVRDTDDPSAFHIEVPAGTSSLALEFQFLSPLTPDAGRVSMTREVLGVEWNDLILYPAGHDARRIEVQPNLRLPEQWQQASALRAASAADSQGWLRYDRVSLETLVDSPVFAGRYIKRVELDGPGAKRPVVLNLFADEAGQLEGTQAQIDAHRRLVQQADKLFGARHYAHYDFLFALSDSFGGIGLEHHQSSENALNSTYFKDWNKAILGRELLPHEYTHSWNGKFRRPRDLWTPNFNEPMHNSLLWLYEGQTQYWGRMLAARSGLVTPEQERDALANVAAVLEHRVGRSWRNLQDTTNEGTMAVQRSTREWRDWQRSFDYYDEATLIWLDADTLIREKSGGKRSLDDFARAFFGVDDGRVEPLLYDFDDIVHALNAVQPYDWADFLRKRLDGNGGGAPLDGLKRGGWQLAYGDEASEFFKATEAEHKQCDLSYSLGLVIDTKDGKLAQVTWGSPAFNAGLAPGMQLVAANWRAFDADRLKQTITAAKGGKQPIELLVKDGESYRTVSVDYHGGLRYPKLVRNEGADRLSAILHAL
ncbi:MAG TPA: peptidase M61 [Methylibium sp.]